MLNSDRNIPEGLNLQKSGEQSPANNNDSDVSRPAEWIRPVKISTDVAKAVDKKSVNYNLYNSFNYSLFLPDDQRGINISLGVTSPNEGEGKTTAVCNLATAISMGIGRRTLIVDLNANNPRIHEIFGIPRGPGVSDGLSGGDICVSPTQTENLFVMPIGTSGSFSPTGASKFRGMLSSLFREFEFVLVDLPATGAGSFPTLISNQLTGLIVVVKQKKTRRRDLEKLFRRVRQETVLAFVMNDVNENDF